ncbi:hypothetical protein HN588_06655 [Candidatus Bathyarchaeota archaeon]|nr:hypothetical protein [Candidatus Bathyarchaeota archaeon]
MTCSLGRPTEADHRQARIVGGQSDGSSSYLPEVGTLVRQSADLGAIYCRRVNGGALDWQDVSEGGIGLPAHEWARIPQESLLPERPYIAYLFSVGDAWLAFCVPPPEDVFFVECYLKERPVSGQWIQIKNTERGIVWGEPVDHYSDMLASGIERRLQTAEYLLISVPGLGPFRAIYRGYSVSPPGTVLVQPLEGWVKHTPHSALAVDTPGKLWVSFRYVKPISRLT